MTAPGAGAPTGTITFSDGAGFSQAGTVGNGGTATVTTAGLSAGLHNITATYTNTDGNFAASSSGTLGLTVGADTTATGVTSSGNPSAFGQSVTFTISVTNTTGTGTTPTGSVALNYTNAAGTGVAPTAPLNGNGQAQISISDLPVGAGQTLTANYTPDTASFAASTGAITQSVNTASTTTTVLSSNNPSAVGQSVTFTAVVSTQAPGVGVPTGSVTFTVSKAGTTPVTLTGTRTAGVNSASYSVGQTFTTGGVYTVSAVYTPDTGSFGGSSGSLSPSQQVVATATTVTVAASPAPARFGQPITLTAHVLGQNGITPTGSIQFSSGGVTLGTQPLTVDPTDLTGNTAVAALPSVSLPTGSPQVTASYSGDGTYAPGSSATVVTVTQADTAVAVSSSSPTSTFGALVRFTATVTDNTPGSTGTPTGSVTFTDTSTGTTLGTGTLLSDGTTQVSTSTLAAGTHTISVFYNGDANFTGSGGSVSQVVNPANTTTTVTPSPAAPGLNQSVVFTTNVTNSSGTGVTPTGTVTFLEGSTILGSGSLSGNGGTARATFSTSFATAGGHTITATYNPSAGNFAGSSDATTVTVGKSGGQNGTLVVVTSSSPQNTSTYGQPVTFTATVPGSGGVTPTGTVTFTDDQSGTSDSRPLNGGTATLSTSKLSASATSHVITAMYSGDQNYGSGQNSTSQTVNPAATRTVVVSSVPTATVGDSVALTATVTNSSSTGVTPAGTVTFSDSLNGANPVALGLPVSVTLDGGDKSLNTATARLDTMALTQGSHTITATFTPEGGTKANFIGSSSTTPALVTVFDKTARPQQPDQASLLVPGTIKYTDDGLVTTQLLKATDTQPLGLFVQNLVQGQVPTVLFNGVAFPTGTVTVDQNNTHLTIQVPASFTSTAGIADVQVVNLNQDPNQNQADITTTHIAVNPVMALPTYPVTNTRAYRLFSMPYDYGSFSPYDIVQATTLSTLGGASTPQTTALPVAGSGGFQYDPVNELLTGSGLTQFTQQATDAAYLALYHWDPNQLRYLTTVPAKDQQADSVPFVLGQAFWAVGGPGAQFLGVTRIGTPAGFNPIGIPLRPGWNMVGDPFPTPVDLGSLQVSYQGVALPFYTGTATPTSAVSQGIVSPIFWSYEQATDGTTGYQLNYSGHTDSSGKKRNAMLPYEGYWLYSYQPCTLLINNTPPASP